jgi:hypothetical protein
MKKKKEEEEYDHHFLNLEKNLISIPLSDDAFRLH